MLMTAILETHGPLNDAEQWALLIEWMSEDCDPDDAESDEDDCEPEPEPPSQPGAWACRICDDEPYRARTECGCCGSAQCSVYCGCAGYEDVWCTECHRAHANPCRTLADATAWCGVCGEEHEAPKCRDPEAECIVCGRPGDLDDDEWCGACRDRHDYEVSR